MIRGTNVYLTRFEEANAEQARAWLNDPEVNEWMLSGQLPISRAQEASFYELTERQWNEGTAYRFEIHLAADERLIGICGLDSVSLLHRTGEVGIFVGSLDDQNQGYGRDAILTLLDFGFNRLGLHRIGIKANSENERAIHLYTSIGFTEVGREREVTFMRGRFRDHICYDMLEPEYRNL
ncbi:MAG: GNAT family N-acetyltransferase [Coriobacteriia bacterium]|nr:GNAT family N-acetyltransferase [Coriobacteriia bacterium]